MITLTFTPLAAGQRSAILSISDDAQNSPQSIQVSGTATAAPPTNPAVSLSPTGLSFGVITQGTAIGPQSVTVTNSGGAPLHISSVVLGGANGGEFIMTNGCTAVSYSVNASCTIGVSFAPLGTGSRSATITLTDDAPNSPQVINLGGNATPAVTLGPAPGGSTSATVSAGQTLGIQPSDNARRGLHRQRCPRIQRAAARRKHSGAVLLCSASHATPCSARSANFGGRRPLAFPDCPSRQTRYGPARKAPRVWWRFRNHCRLTGADHGRLRQR